MCVGAHGLCKRVCVLSHFSRVRLSATPWTVAHQAPLSMEILQARILEWVAMLSSKVSSLTSPALAGGFFTASATWEAHCVGTG